MPVYNICSVPVHFPFEAYDCQLAYMRRVIEALQKEKNALLESPTGTGKTLCLLCATLAWRERVKQLETTGTLQGGANQGGGGLHPGSGANTNNNQQESLASSSKTPSPPNIIYASRTHSQLRQVIKELKATPYRPKMCVLGSREQLCIHEDVSQLKGVVQKNACRFLLQRRGCPHFGKLPEFAHSNPQLGSEPIDIEDLLKLGREKGPCPYFLARELHNKAELIFVPYTYLINRQNRGSLTAINWENTVLIFDEAHNVQGVCEEASSFDLSTRIVEHCIEEADHALKASVERAASGQAAENSSDPENFAILKALLREVLTRLKGFQLEKSGEGLTKPGSFLLEFFADMKITFETVPMLIDTIEQAIDLLTDGAVAQVGFAGGSVSCRLNILKEALEKIFGPNSNETDAFKVHVHDVSYGPEPKESGEKKGTRTLSYWCFDPGLCMREFARMGVKTILLTSGTLAPLEPFGKELKLPFNIYLENPHVIPPSQIWVGVVSTGPSGKPLNSSYRNRESMEYKIDLGNAIVNWARIVPDGLLVFFPSYNFMTSCLQAWKTVPSGSAPSASTVWDRILRHKLTVEEPRDAALFRQANEDFMAKINDATSYGAVFFAVCRGKVSEGIDFSDKAGRAVVITGIPYAMRTDPWVCLKREHLDEQAMKRKGEKHLSGNEWYMQEATRAVNQAMGRVIRHRNDYGAIILCDERFGSANMVNQLSKWLRPYVNHFAKFGDAAFSLTKFFRETHGSKLNVQSEDENGCKTASPKGPEAREFVKDGLNEYSIGGPFTFAAAQARTLTGHKKTPTDAPRSSMSGSSVNATQERRPDLLSELSRKSWGYSLPAFSAQGVQNRAAENVDNDSWTGGGGLATQLPAGLNSQAGQRRAAMNGGTDLLKSGARIAAQMPSVLHSHVGESRAGGGNPNLNAELPGFLQRRESALSILTAKRLQGSSHSLAAIHIAAAKDATGSASGTLGISSRQTVESPHQPRPLKPLVVGPAHAMDEMKRKGKLEVGPIASASSFVNNPLRKRIKREDSDDTDVNRGVSQKEACAEVVKKDSSKGRVYPKPPTQASEKQSSGSGASDGDDRVVSSQPVAPTSQGPRFQNGPEFLKEVKAVLSAGEYVAFFSYMKLMKEGPQSGVEVVLRKVASLFSAPERYSLLERFSSFVPSQYKPMFQELMKRHPCAAPLKCNS